MNQLCHAMVNGVAKPRECRRVTTLTLVLRADTGTGTI